MRSYRPSTSSAHHKMTLQVERRKEKSKLERRVHGLAIQDNIGRKDSRVISSRMLKRASHHTSTVLEAYNGTGQKNAVGWEGKRQRIDPATFKRKVDAVSHPVGNLVEKSTHDSFYNGLSGYYDSDGAKVDIAVNGSIISRSSEENDFDSEACSVGSCSAHGMRADKFSNCSAAVPFLGRDLLSSDAESYCRCFDEEEDLSHCSEEKVEDRGASVGYRPCWPNEV